MHTLWSEQSAQSAKLLQSAKLNLIEQKYKRFSSASSQEFLVENSSKIYFIQYLRQKIIWIVLLYLGESHC